jgi:hypothetical protein
VTVEEGVVVGRSFEGGPQPDVVSESWTETAADLGTHAGGDEAKTFEEIYDECDEILAVDPDDNTILLDFDDDGILRHCQYTIVECQDGCTEGIFIEEVQFASSCFDDCG